MESRLKIFTRIFVLLAFGALIGCTPSALDKAEYEFLAIYKDYKAKTKNLESTREAVRIWEGRVSEANNELRQKRINREYHDLAKSGALGTGEALIAAKKMLNDKSYESQLYSGTSQLQRDIEFAEERLKIYRAELGEEYQSADRLLPKLKDALEYYEKEFDQDALANREPRRQSSELKQSIKDVKEIVSDAERRRYWSELEASRKR